VLEEDVVVVVGVDVVDDVPAVVVASVELLSAASTSVPMSSGT
jgi:hypothetical protein